jgi:predicted secreted protein
LSRDTESAKHIVLAVGEEYTIALRGLAMAGYQWSGSVTGASPGAVTLELRRGELQAGSKAGLSVPEAAVLRAIRPGHALVRLQQRRSWERDNPPAQLLELHVDVRA